jgi:hypothetical protein
MPRRALNASPRPLNWVCLLVLSCLVCSSALAEPNRKTIDGVPHIMNTATPSQGTQILQMKELWRVGDDDEHLFGLIPRAGSDREGNIYILDTQLNQVSVFSPAGELLHTLFREGEGPGEVTNPVDFMVLADGRVGAVQEFPGAVVFVDQQGLPAGKIRLGGSDGGMMGTVACDAYENNFLIAGNSQKPGQTPGISDRTYFVSSFDGEGLEKVRYCESHSVYNFNDFQFIEREHTPALWWGFDAGPGGRTCALPHRDRYAIHVYAADGSTELVIERESTPLARTEEEYNHLYRIYESALATIPVDYRLVVERQAAAVAYMHRGLRMQEDGSIWALSARGIRELPDGVFAIWDVFNPQGEFIKQMELRGPGDSLTDGMFFVGDDRLLVVKGYMESLGAQFGSGTVASEEDEEEAATPMVICYQLQ